MSSTITIFLLIVLMLLVAVLPSRHSEPRENFLNMVCTKVKAEGGKLACGDLGTVAQMDSEKIPTPDGGVKVDTMLTCCMPEKPRICVETSCLYEKDIKYILRLPLELRKRDLALRQAQKETVAAKMMAVAAKEEAIAAHKLAKKCWDSLDGILGTLMKLGL